MGIQGNRLADIQQCYFDVCDLLLGQSYKGIGYDSRKEMLEEFKERLARIEDAYKEACGIKEEQESYECVCCEKQHTQEFSLTCPECDSERESGGLELPKEYRD